MEKLEAAQVVMEFIRDNEGASTTDIVEHITRNVDASANLNGVGGIVDWLYERDFVSGTQTMGPETLFLKPTPYGESVILRGITVKEAMIEKHSGQASSVNQSNQFNGPVGQFAQGNSNTMNQTNITIDVGDIAPVLQVMREHGDDETADAVEALNESGDGKGALKYLVERFRDKTVDAGYAAIVLPVLAKLVGVVTGLF